jgi:hypothetical protein
MILKPGKKHLFLDISSTNIDTFIPSPYQCVRTQHRSLFFFYYCLNHFRTSISTSSSLREFLDPVVNRFMRQTLSTINRRLFIINMFCIESFCPQKSHNRMLLFSSTILKHGRHFDYWNQPLNMRMYVCYLDCHEAGLCCYLVITHRKPILDPLQLFYFHLWSI